MPVVKSGSPTVSLQLPVPTPVQPKPKAPPVAFGGEGPTQPAQQPDSTGVPPVAPPQRQLRAVILPWSPAPSSKSQAAQMKRKVVRYAAPINAVQPGETAHEALTRFLGTRNRRAHGRTAYVERLGNGDIGVTLHNTRVVTAHPNGQVTMNHGGYMTPTSRRFISGYSGIPVSFAGGEFRVRNPQTGAWETYENNTPYPPPQQPVTNEPVPERGRFTPEQAELLRQHELTGEKTPLGMLGDSLAESGYPHTGELISRLATNDPGAGGNRIGEYHGTFQQSPHLNEYDFHFVPGRGKHDLHELHVELPKSNGIRQQFRVVGSHPVPEQLSRRRVVINKRS